jgi:RNA polymerase sigma-70 factor (ECF subfamily)
MAGTPELDDYSPSTPSTPTAAPAERRTSGFAPARRLALQEDRNAWQSRADEAMVSYGQGENAAFPKLYDALAPKLYAFLLRRVPASGANDLLQQTFLQLHVHRGQFIAGSSVAAYAFAICRRLCIDRKRRARPELSFSDDDAGAFLEAECGDVAGAIDARDALAAMKVEVEALDPEQYELFELVYMENLPHAQVAGILGITTNAVKLRANRLRASIARSLEKRGLTRPR